MLAHEEAKILRYLRGHVVSRLADLAGVCLPGASPDWVRRVLADLEWSGYVVVYCDPVGEPIAVQPTERGLRYHG